MEIKLLLIIQSILTGFGHFFLMYHVIFSFIFDSVFIS